jgi:hypothetical protein
VQLGDDDQLSVSALGAIKFTQIPTLLKLGAKQVETQLGIE